MLDIIQQKISGSGELPNYGYARGMNQVKYQHMYMGYSVEQVHSRCGRADA